MRVLFVLQSIIYGGSMTSLINLVRLLNEDDRVKCDMLFMLPDGPLYKNATMAGHVIDTDVFLRAVTERRSAMTGMKWLHLYPVRALCFAMGCIKHMSCAEFGYRLSAPRYKEYDIVVAYQEGVATDFVRRIPVRNKVAWVHNDFDNVKKIYADNMDALYNAFDRIVCVSNAGMNQFLKKSNIEEKKYRLCRIYNSFNVWEIKHKAQEPDDDFICDERFSMVSIGRITHQKRFDRAIEVAKQLRSEGNLFHWYIVGSGDMLSKYKAICEDEGITDVLHFIGAKANPYAILAKCDLMVITSEFEAHPMVANESLILGVPVVMTGFESASEVVHHGVNGLICDNCTEGVLVEVRNLIKDEAQYNTLRCGAGTFHYDNNEIKKQVVDMFMQLVE